MLRIVIALMVLLASLSTHALASDCPGGACRVERARSVERGGVKRERRVERVRLVRR